MRLGSVLSGKGVVAVSGEGDLQCTARAPLLPRGDIGRDD